MNEPIYVASLKENSEESFRFTWRGCLYIVIVLIVMIIGGIIGLFLSNYIMLNKIYPSWQKTDIYLENLVIEEILSLDNNNLFLDSDNFSNDKLFVVAEDNKPYLFTQNQWQPILPLPNDFDLNTISTDIHGDLYASSANNEIFTLKNNQWISYNEEFIVNYLYFSENCASRWNSPPPIKEPILDSAGLANSGHDFDRFLRCYVLLQNGHLQLWSYSNPFSQQLSILGFGAFLGSLIGGIISFLTIRFFRNHRMKGVS